MKTFKQQVTEEYLASLKRRVPDIDQKELEVYEAIFLTGFDVGKWCDTKFGQEMMIQHFSSLNNNSPIN